MEIRIATADDAAQIRAIYEPYVRNTAITFEYDVPDVEEFRKRITYTLQQYPYLVAVREGRIVGYAYAGPFRTRAAYQHAAEVSVYVEETLHGSGIGRHLYQALETYLRRQNVFVLYACITMTDRKTDEHLPDGSIFFHQAMGYHLAGTFRQCGWKFDKWYHMIWMEKEICAAPEKPDAFLPFAP